MMYYFTENALYVGDTVSVRICSHLSEGSGFLHSTLAA